MWYTPRVETLFGDTAKVTAAAGSLIAGANTANNDSGTGFVFQVASLYKIDKDFDGTQMSNSLNYISPFANNNTAINNTHNAERDSSKADLISLMVDGTKSSGVAGLGWVLKNIAGSQNVAYNSILHTVSSKTFSHECGHNMGLGHDASQGSKGILANSWGNHFTAGGKGYRTIMAYGKSGYQTRVNLWSGPSVMYQGTATGSSSADAVGTLKQTSIPVSKYR